MNNDKKGGSVDLIIKKMIFISVITAGLSVLVACDGDKNKCGLSVECEHSDGSLSPVLDDKKPIDGTDTPGEGSGDSSHDGDETTIKPELPIVIGFDDLENKLLPDELIGEWTSIVDTREQKFTMNVDGTCHLHVNYVGNGSAQANCKWGVIEEDGERILVTEDENKVWSSYSMEMFTETDFRLLGADLKVDSILYSKAIPETVAARYPGRWMIGIWEFLVWEDLNIYRQSWDFKASGELEVDTYVNWNNAYLSNTVGTWSSTATKLTYSFDDSVHVASAPKSGTYPFANVSVSGFELPGTSSEILFDDWERKRIPIFRPDLFAGQYLGASTTITIKKQEDKFYDVRLNFEGRIENWRGEVSENLLQVLLPESYQFLGNTTLVLEARFNGIGVVSAPPGLAADLPSEMRKISESQLAVVDDVVGGVWHKRLKFLSTQVEMMLFPDGQYVEYNGNLEENGTYEVVGDQSANFQLKIDPECNLPYVQETQLVENQWVHRYTQSTGEDLISVYHYEPRSKEKIVNIMNQFNRSRALLKDEWENQKLTGSLDSSYQPIPIAVTTNGSRPVNADLLSGEVFENATVFKEMQIYYWIAPWPMCDPTQVLLCDTAQFQFYPNGRLLYYSDTKWAIETLTGKPVIDDFHVWVSYTIKDDKIYISDSLSLDILNGGQQIRFGEFCHSKL